MIEIMPIPIRADRIVRIAGIPHDLTKAEARRIADIVRAYAYVAKLRDARGRFVKRDQPAKA